MRPKVTYAHTVRPGDSVLIEGEARRVERVRRAQGRKPARGENLHLVLTAGDYVRVNSSDPVRVVRSG